jgi:hypothetical protein
VSELVRDIEAYLAERNANPRPYKWKPQGAAILDKIKRARTPRNGAGCMSSWAPIESQHTRVWHSSLPSAWRATKPLMSKKLPVDRDRTVKNAVRERYSEAALIRAMKPTQAPACCG